MKILNGFVIECEDLDELNKVKQMYIDRGYYVEAYEDDLLLDVYGDGYLPNELCDLIMRGL